VQYLNNLFEQDHRAIKRRINASQHFPLVLVCVATIAGSRGDSYDPQRQACWSAADVKVGLLLHRFILGLFVATS
jgi:hypothetical protein